MLNEDKQYRNHHAKNAVKAAQVTNHIKARKKDGLTHDEAKAEAYRIYKIKSNMRKETCDKCDCEVTTENCSITMHCIAWDEPYVGLLARRRCINCSPSRAQHIVHPDFPPVVDDRERYDKRNSEIFPNKEKVEEFEKRWTAAWLICQHPEIADAVMQKLVKSRKDID